MRASAIVALAIGLSCVAACGGEPAAVASPRASRVIHLDPRLAAADGELAAAPSSAEALHERGPTVFDEIAVAKPGDSLGKWTLKNATVLPVLNELGFYVVANVEAKTPEGFEPVELVFDRPFDASEVDAVELVLAHTERGVARATWRRADDAPEADTWTRHVSAPVITGDAEQLVRIELGRHAGFEGLITKLSIVPKQEGRQRFELRRVRLVRGGFGYGPDRLGAPSGDGGLIAIEREGRRVWPSDFGVTLRTTVQVPPKARLVVQWSPATAPATTDSMFVELGAWHDGAWAATLQQEFLVEDGIGWRTLSLDLGVLAGREVELHFNAYDLSPTRTEPSLEAASVYWAEPMLLVDEGPARRNILFVTLDTTRADALGCYGDPRAKTPYFDELAKRSWVFEDAWSACNSTTPSHASMLTGLAVQDHGVVDNLSMLGADNVSIVERIREAGYHTAAAVSVEHLQTGKSGLGQGFDRFLLAASDATNDGAITVRAAKTWLQEWKQSGGRPFFLWLHLFDAHTPYAPPQAFLDEYCKRHGLTPPPKTVVPPTMKANASSGPGEFLAGVDNREHADFLYRASVAYTDSLIENVASELAALGWLDDTVICVVADHGEALGEHDHWYNHLGLYREVMRVPLILRVPGEPAKRVAPLVSTLDLAPTLLELAGAQPIEGLRGQSLIDVARGSVAQRRVWFEHSNLVQVGCRDERFHAITTQVEFAPWDGARTWPKGSLELYDAREDLEQLRDLAASDPRALETYRTLFEQWRASALERASEPAPLDQEDIDRLRELGY